MDANVLDGQPDDTPITDRNQKSITTILYMDGTGKRRGQVQFRDPAGTALRLVRPTEIRDSTPVGRSPLRQLA